MCEYNATSAENLMESIDTKHYYLVGGIECKHEPFSTRIMKRVEFNELENLCFSFLLVKWCERLNRKSVQCDFGFVCPYAWLNAFAKIAFEIQCKFLCDSIDVSNEQRYCTFSLNYMKLKCRHSLTHTHT